MVNEAKKACRTCLIELPLYRFHKNSRNADGLRTKCKTCTLEYLNKYRNERRNEYREKNKRYYSAHINTDGYRDRRNERSRRAVENLPPRYVIYCLVKGSSIARGDLPLALIEKKREQLLMKRAVRELKKALPKPERQKNLDASRRCCVCKVIFPLEFFLKVSANPSGRGYRCVECNRAANRAYYRERKA